MVDMSNITGMYSDMYANAANQSANKLQSQLDGKDYSKASDAELMDACKQFEAYFIEQMYKGMLKTIPKNEETSHYTSTLMDYYQDQMVQSVAKETSDQSGLGLAQMLYEQLKRNYGLTDVPTAQDLEGVEAAQAAV